MAYYSRPSYAAETPPPANIAHPVPHQSVAPYLPNASSHSSIPAHLSTYEDGKIYALVIELMDPMAREGALLELSKKREQYDDLALVLWHSFGAPSILFCKLSLTPPRHHASLAAGNCVCIPATLAAESHCPCLQPGLQCPCLAAMCRLPHRHASTLLEWSVHFPSARHGLILYFL